MNLLQTDYYNDAQYIPTTEKDVQNIVEGIQQKEIIDEYQINVVKGRKQRHQ